MYSYISLDWPNFHMLSQYILNSKLLQEIELHLMLIIQAAYC